MAITPNAVQAPEVSVIGSYSINRINEYPSVEWVVYDTNRVREDPVTVQSMTGAEIVVPDWAGRTDLPGHEIDAMDGSLIGKIIGWDEGTTTATLADVPATDLTGVEVKLVEMSLFGSPLHDASAKSRHARYMSTNNPQHYDYIAQMLGTMYVSAVMYVLGAMGDTTYTQADVEAAVLSLAQSGWNIDSVMSQGIEQAELDYRSGVLDGVSM